MWLLKEKLGCICCATQAPEVAAAVKADCGGIALRASLLHLLGGLAEAFARRPLLPVASEHLQLCTAATPGGIDARRRCCSHVLLNGRDAADGFAWLAVSGTREKAACMAGM